MVITADINASINSYQTARNHFNGEGGNDFLSERRDLRTSFAQSYNWCLKVDPSSTPRDLLTRALEILDNPKAHDEREGRFNEWTQKIAKNKLNETGSMTVKDFSKKANEFYSKWAS